MPSLSRCAALAVSAALACVLCAGPAAAQEAPPPDPGAWQRLIEELARSTQALVDRTIKRAQEELRRAEENKRRADAAIEAAGGTVAKPGEGAGEPPAPGATTTPPAEGPPAEEAPEEPAEEEPAEEEPPPPPEDASADLRALSGSVIEGGLGWQPVPAPPVVAPGPLVLPFSAPAPAPAARVTAPVAPEGTVTPPLTVREGTVTPPGDGLPEWLTAPAPTGLPPVQSPAELLTDNFDEGAEERMGADLSGVRQTPQAPPGELALQAG